MTSPALRPEEAPRCLPMTAEQAFAILMQAAADGDNFEKIDAVARRCQWATFRANAAWFYDIMIDPVAVCLRPDGQSLAVCAGTDSDGFAAL